jgi:class 3 adenylate cyclase
VDHIRLAAGYSNAVQPKTRIYRAVLRILVFISLFFSSVLVQAQTLVWTGKERSVLITRDCKFLEDAGGKETIETLTAPGADEKFVLNSRSGVSFQRSASVYWMRFKVNNGSGQELLLELAQSLVPSATLYYRDSGQWRSMQSGNRINLYQKPYVHHYQVFPLPTSDDQYYLRVESNGNPIPFTLWNRSAYDDKIRDQKIIFGIYMGIMLFVILNNLFLFVSMGRMAYLHYSLLVFLYASFSALYEGYILYLFPHLDLVFWDVLNPIINQPNGLLFTILFLNVKRWLPGLYKPAMALFIYFCSFIIWHRFLSLPTVFALTQAHALIGILVMATLGILCGRKGNRLGRYFALAYFVFFLVASIEVVYLQTGKPSHIFDLSFVSIAIFLEVFFLLLLLSKRFQWEKRDMELARAEAQRQLLLQTQENERITRQQNVILEQRVLERTGQLQKANEDLNQSLHIIEKEKEKSEALLLNILPAKVAEELKEHGSADAHLFEQVTVLFSDFVSFTTISEKMGPKELVQKLDFFFKHFDEIIGRHGLEKIKTIGDAYLAVCGLPAPHEDHAQRGANASLDIIKFIELEGGEFKIRIGLHSGPVVAGIVGAKKFAYDIWGDTVNIAARMEQHSQTGRINVTGETKTLLQDKYRFTSRGKIVAKNKGEIEMYFLDGKI